MGAGLNLFFAKNHSPSSPRIAPRPRPPNAPAPPREARKHPDTQCERCRGKPSFSAERLEEGQRRRLVSRAGARRSLNGGGVDFLFWGGRGSQGYTKGMHRVQYTHRGTHVHTQGYTDVQRGPRGTRGYTWVHGGTQGHTSVHMGAQGVHTGTQGVHKGYCTQGRGTVHRGTSTQGYTGVQYIGVHRGTQGYTGVHVHSF